MNASGAFIDEARVIEDDETGEMELLDRRERVFPIFILEQRVEPRLAVRAPDVGDDREHCVPGHGQSFRPIRCSSRACRGSR